jgi:hypothetical protein
MAQMKTIFVEEFGEPEVLRYTDAERPSPGEREALIEVRSAGVNYADTMRRRNQYVVSQDLPFVPGSEVAGTVAEVGEGVENVSVGDRAVTLLGTGGYAEYAVAPARNLIPIPEGLDFDQAAAIPLQGLTAYHCIKTSGSLKEGESVLVHAAAGGVGTLAVQMAKLLGAGKVIATASSEEKLDLARSLGADVPDRLYQGRLAREGTRGHRRQGRRRDPGDGRQRLSPKEPDVPERFRKDGCLRRGEPRARDHRAGIFDERVPRHRRFLPAANNAPPGPFHPEPAGGAGLDLLRRPRNLLSAPPTPRKRRPKPTPTSKAERPQASSSSTRSDLRTRFMAKTLSVCAMG